MLKYIVVFAGASLLAISLPAKAQEQRDIVALSSEEIMTPFQIPCLERRLSS